MEHFCRQTCDQLPCQPNLSLFPLIRVGFLPTVVLLLQKSIFSEEIPKTSLKGWGHLWAVMSWWSVLPIFFAFSFKLRSKEVVEYVDYFLKTLKKKCMFSLFLCNKMLFLHIRPDRWRLLLFCLAALMATLASPATQIPALFHSKRSLWFKFCCPTWHRFAENTVLRCCHVSRGGHSADSAAAGAVIVHLGEDKVPWHGCTEPA